MTPDTSGFFVFSSHCDCVLYPKHSSCCLHSTCFISCNRHLPLHILWRGGCEAEGYCIISRRCCAFAAFTNWHPSKSLVGQCIKQDLFEMEMLCFCMDFSCCCINSSLSCSLHRQAIHVNGSLTLTTSPLILDSCFLIDYQQISSHTQTTIERVLSSFIIATF